MNPDFIFSGIGRQPEAAPPAVTAAGAATGAQPGQSRFLRPTDHDVIRRQLRGVRMVELRQIGGTAEDGAEVLAHLESQGFAVKFRLLERMSPPPLCRMVFRYHGPKQAELTIAPEVKG